LSGRAALAEMAEIGSYRVVIGVLAKIDVLAESLFT
jgi:hypothetical protein